MLKFYAAFLSAAAELKDRCTRDDEGATAVEYGLMVALIAVVILGAVATLGTKLNGLFTTVANNLP